MATNETSLHVADYAIFATTLLVSILIGIYHACAGAKQKTTAEYLVGNRSMSMIPVSFSYVVTYMSSIFMLGLPAEMYIYGVTYLLSFFSIAVSNVLAVLIAVPLFHPLQLTSSYEYLEKRFNSLGVRKMGAIFGVLSNTLYMGVVLYGPAVALHTVARFPLWASVFVVGIASIIYTSIGGIKAVIWTDVFQCVIIFIGLLAIVVKSIMEVGGFGNFYRHNLEGGRFEMNWSFDPTVRMTFWNSLFASMVGWFGLAFNQSSVQRIASMPTQTHAKKMILLSTPGFLLLAVAAALEGFAAFAYYRAKHCDPFAANSITNSNEILPFFVMELFQSLPGMAGLFMASLFSASLSTLSSGLNGIAANTVMDFLLPIWPNISETRRTGLAKLCVVIFGFISIGISFLVMEIGGPITQICTSLLGSLGGPISGLFLVAAFIPWANAKGAIAGGIMGFGCCMWVNLGSQVMDIKTPWLPLSDTDSCPANITANFTSIFNTSIVTEAMIPVKLPEEGVGLERLYALSFMCYSLFGLTICIVVTLVVSLITGLTNPRDVDPVFISHLIRGYFFTEEEIEVAKARRAKKGLELIVIAEAMDEKDEFTKDEDGNGNIFKPVTPPPHVIGSVRRPLLKDPDDDLLWRNSDNQ